jgi:putative acetyltransferase
MHRTPVIRAEQPADAAAVHQVHATAFPTAAEAQLVDLLRAAGKAWISLVAEIDGRIVGQVLFSPVTVDAWVGVQVGVGLAPVAVLPAYQRQGIGRRLIQAGLAECRRVGRPFVVVLGEPGYYSRFGFQRASARGLTNEYGVDEPFLVLELEPGTLPAGGGLVKYAPEFAELGTGWCARCAKLSQAPVHVAPSLH